MTYPEIRIQNGWLLRRNASKYLHELWGKGKQLSNDEDVQKVVEAYKDAWQPYERKILEGLYKTTDLEFYQNTIDVFVAPWFAAFSSPMVIGVIYEPDDFIDTLTHELIHRLLTDNKTIPYDTKFFKPWRELFGEELEDNMLIHIPVHAVHKAIYLDVLKEPERFKRDVEFCIKYDHKPYIDAWDYVEKHGYEEIIAKLKKSYQKMAQTK